MNLFKKIIEKIFSWTNLWYRKFKVSRLPRCFTPRNDKGKHILKEHCEVRHQSSSRQIRAVFKKDIVLPPNSCSVVVTSQCCLECKMCHMWKQPLSEKPELSVRDCKRIIDQVKDFLGGTKEFVISGGEPLMKEGIFEIIKHASASGLKTVMPTNGWLLSKENAEKLAGSGLSELFISLDSCNASIHDYLRGKVGVFEKIQKGIEYLDSLNSEIRINFLCLIAKPNLHDLIQHLHIIQNDKRVSGVYFQAVSAPFFTGLGNDWYLQDEFKFLWPNDYAEVENIIDEIARLKKEEHFMVHNAFGQLEQFKRYFKNPIERASNQGCSLGDRVLNIDPAGQINLCCFKAPVGNIFDDKIKKLWYSNKLNQERQRMRNCLARCHNTVNCFFEDEK